MSDDTANKPEDSQNTPITADKITKSDDTTNKPEDSQNTPITADKITKKFVLGKIFKIFSIIIWSVIILLILIPLLGRLIMSNALAAELPTSQSIEITQPLVAFTGKEVALKKALNTAHQNAEQYAEKELDQWEAELIKRIDTDFLNWYFSYFNQKKEEISVFFQYVAENVINGFNQAIVNENISKRINNDIQNEFSKRVLEAASAQMKFKAIVIDTANLYIQDLAKEFDNIPKMYKIPLADWNEYLEGINLRLKTEQGEQVFLLTFIGGVTAAKITATFAAKTASKAVATVYAQLGSMIEPTVAIALIAWDYLDYTNGVKENRPRLRQDLVNYLDNLKKDLLRNPEHGVMSTVNELEQKIKDSISLVEFAA